MTSTAKGKQPHRPSLWSLAEKHWFILSLLLVIICAQLQPTLGHSGGPLRPAVVKRIGVTIIFFSSGLKIEPAQLLAAAANWPVHVLVSAVSLGLVPLAVYSTLAPTFAALLRLFAAMPSESDAWITSLCRGLLVLSCLPSPVGSAVILTKAAGGREATAIFNATIGSLLGIVATPSLVFLYLGASGSVPLHATLISLGSTVLVPLVCGIFARMLFERTAPAVLKLPFSTISQLVLLFIVYTTFCDAFFVPPSGKSQTHDVPMSGLILLECTLITLHASCLAIIKFIGIELVGITRADTIAAMFCAGQKSLTLGIPMVNMLFGGQKDLGIVVLPLLMYHPTQILMDSLIVAGLRSW
eukprot:jgi/Hompol1/3144/HPOL_006364-RA